MNRPKPKPGKIEIEGVGFFDLGNVPKWAQGNFSLKDWWRFNCILGSHHVASWIDFNQGDVNDNKY
jgi:hypothetical protein